MTDDKYGAARFAADTRNHQLTILHDDCLYRHLRFQAPDSGIGWFDLVTWPGKLAITGDMDGFVFSRVEEAPNLRRNPGVVGNLGSEWFDQYPNGVAS